MDRVLRVLCAAMHELHAEQDLPLAEEAVDRRFCLKVREAYFRLEPDQRPLSFALHPKAEHAPLTGGDIDEDWVRKKPDFKWRMHNDLAATPQELTMDFDIECKRLGRPTSKGWILTEQYVVSGIVRFLSADHRYGNGVNAGAMIGYVQNSLPSDLSGEVNDCLARETEPVVPGIHFPQEDWGAGPVMITSHELARMEVDPSHFVLHHLWVDLQSN